MNWLIRAFALFARMTRRHELPTPTPVPFVGSEWKRYTREQIELDELFHE